MDIVSGMMKWHQSTMSSTLLEVRHFEFLELAFHEYQLLMMASMLFYCVQGLLKIQSESHRYYCEFSLMAKEKHVRFYLVINILISVLQWMLQIPGATSYIGCIGKDKFGEEMKKNSKLAGVNVNSAFISQITISKFINCCL